MTTTSPGNQNNKISPQWSSTTKIVVGLTVGGLVVATSFYLRAIIGPLLLMVVTAYLLHPLAAFLSNRTRLSWRAAVNIIYLLLVILLIGLSTAAGLAIVQQTQSLIRTLQRILSDLPLLLESMSSQAFSFGPFQINLKDYLDIDTLSSQLLGLVQPLLGQAGSLVGTVAGGAANIATWLFFVLLISYFSLADAGQFPDAINFINIPGYDEDVRRMSRELARIWNAFLRGQVTIVLLVIIAYTIIWTALGTRYSLALAVLAGLARFVPYVGQTITWIALVSVTLFQGNNYFGLEPLQYTLLIVIPTFIIDQIFDNFISPRIMGQSLRISPGAVLVVAIIAANLIGIIGLVLAAPVLASMQLISRYVLRKMLDQDPWPGLEMDVKSLPIEAGGRLLRRLRAWWRMRRNRS